MSSYAQTTIHSRSSKVQKVKGEHNAGRLVKGIRLGISHSLDRRIRNKLDILSINDNNIDLEISQEYTKQLQVDKSKHKASDLQDVRRQQNASYDYKADSHYLLDSAVFPAIYFKKTTMRNILKQFTFPDGCRALPPNNDKSPLIYQIVANLFNEITFYVFNILVCVDEKTNNYYTFFSDSEIIPYTKCCRSPAFVELKPNGTGRIVCNGPACQHPSLAQFLINYQDGRKIWDNLTFLSTAPEKDIIMKQHIAKCIKTGKFKNHQLKKIVESTTREVSKVFSLSKYPADLTFNKEADEVNEQNNFITEYISHQPKATSVIDSKLDEEEVAELMAAEDKNLELLKVKVQYMAKRQKSLRKNLAKVIVDESKIFHKKFQFSQKIDDLLRKTQYSHHSASFSFPRLMEGLRAQQKRRVKGRSVSNTFAL